MPGKFKLLRDSPANNTNLNRCQKLVIATALVSVLSIAAGNMLILLRVLILWGRDNTIRKVLYIVYALSTCVTLALMIMTSLDLARKWKLII